MSDSPNNYNGDSTAPRLLPPGRQEGPERAQNLRAATHRRMPRSLHRRWMGIVPGQSSYDLPYAPAWDVRGERTSIPRRTPTDWQRALGVLSNQWRTIIIFAAHCFRRGDGCHICDATCVRAGRQTADRSSRFRGFFARCSRSGSDRCGIHLNRGAKATDG